jgi:hypothetical protein
METLIEFAATSLPIAIAIMGIVVTFSPPMGRARMAVVAAFSVLGGIAAWSGYYEMHSTNIAQQKLLDETNKIRVQTTGGDYFCYITGNGEVKDGLVSQVNTILVCPGKARIYDVKIDVTALTEDKPMRTGHATAAILEPGSQGLNMPLDLGKYFINISAKNGQWREKLRFYVENNLVRSDVTIIDEENKVVLKNSFP